MLWKSGPIPMYQFTWYAPGMGKGTVGPYIGTICFPSTPTQSRMRTMHLWAGVENNTTSTPVPPVDSVPADAGLSGKVMPSTAGSTPQGSLDQAAPLRCGT